MATADRPKSSEQADIEEICRLSSEGKRVTDPGLLKRIQGRSERARAESKRDWNWGVKAIREMRGPLDENQERELTLAQMDLVRKGDVRLVDPETGDEYVLVPIAEYKRLRGERGTFLIPMSRSSGWSMKATRTRRADCGTIFEARFTNYWHRTFFQSRSPTR